MTSRTAATASKSKDQKLKEAAAREHKHEHENMSVSMSTSAADLNAIKSDVPQSHCLIVTFSISNTSVQNTFWA